MRTHAVFVALAASLVGCKKSADEQPGTSEKPVAAATSGTPQTSPAQLAQAAGADNTIIADGFAITRPAGYDPVPDDLLAKMSEQIGQHAVVALGGTRPGPDYFKPSIVIVKVAANDLTREAACTSVSEPLAQVTGASVQQSDVTYPFGKTCQFTLADTKQSALMTVAYLGTKYWAVTCNFDPRDKAAPDACRSVLQSFASR